MGRYVLRRLLQLVPVFLGTTFLIYLLVWALPGDPFAGKCGERACPDAYVARMREEFHLDENVLVHAQSDQPREALRHPYLHGARQLRSDLPE